MDGLENELSDNNPILIDDEDVVDEEENRKHMYG